MAQQRNDAPLRPAAFDEPIQPIDFSPASAARRAWLPRLSPARLGLAAALGLFAGAAWFVLTAKSVFLDVNPPQAEIDVSGPLALRVGPRYLMREGEARVRVEAAGYEPFETALRIGTAQAQTYRLELQPLPGFLDLRSGAVEGAQVYVDGEAVGLTPLLGLELAAGEHSLRLEKERYEPVETELRIEGRATTQSLDLELLPAWAELSLSSNPPGAAVFIDGEERGVTPLSTEVLAGEREVLVKLPAHKAWTEQLRVRAREDLALPPIELEAADGLVLLRSNPSNAGVLLNGTYQGQTPLEVAVTPGRNSDFTFLLNGYQEARRSLRIEAGQESALEVSLQPITSEVRISAVPADAELYVNGQPRGNANQTLALLATTQEIEIRREGYVPYRAQFVSRPGLEQKLEVELMTLEAQRLANIKPEITSPAGQVLKLVHPGSFTMGASRREAGRQANEVLRPVTLSRPYYLSLTEVSNAQFARFDSQHRSGVVEGRNISLSNDAQPVVRVSWEQAALYCNWLSQQEGLPPFYQVSGGKVTGVNAESTGYRLPTEAEWDWAARVGDDPASLLRFPWGMEMPPPENHGNYADLSAADLLGRILPNYNDSFLASAPVGSFPANAQGFHDMGGNAAEWVHDYYGTGSLSGGASETDPLGPDSGNYHVIKGSSWAHGTITQLRLSYRDYGDGPRDDVGFRIARYLE